MKGTPKAETVFKLVMPADRAAELPNCQRGPRGADKFDRVNGSSNNININKSGIDQFIDKHLKLIKARVVDELPEKGLQESIYKDQQKVKRIMIAKIPSLIQFFCNKLINPVGKKGKQICLCKALPTDNHW